MSASFLEALDSLSTRRIVLFGGKGGVGKTTVSSIAALHYAKTRRVVLFTTDPASNLRDLFATGDETGLQIEQLDAVRLYTRFLGSHVENFLEIADRGTYLDREELRRFFELSLPGADEVMAWMRIGELAEENADAIVVVDTAPTGHALRMLAAGEHFRQFAAALDAMQAKHRSLVRQFTRRDVRDAADVFIDEFEEKARSRRDMLRDSAQTAFVPVMLSEPWVVEQTIRLIDEVRAGGVDVPFAVLNRAVGEPDCALCVERSRADGAAHERLAPLRVVEMRRVCRPLDDVGALRGFMDFAGGGAGAPLSTEESHFAGEAAGAPLRLPAAKMIFVAGKGGVGKTTIAASIALQLARADPGANFTIISVDPAHALRDVFSSEQPPSNLRVEMIDTRAKWQRFRQTLGLEIEKAVAALTPSGLTVAYDTDALQKLIEVAPPGADELFAVNRLAALAADPEQDRVIVDTAPTGHFLRLMDLPATAGEWVREFMRILLRYRDLIPAGSLGSELVNASRSLTALRETLASDRASVIVVTRPERVVVAETRRLFDALRERRIAAGALVANYVTPETSCPCDRAARASEVAALRELEMRPVVVERQQSAVTRLDELARLLTIESDSTPE